MCDALAKIEQNIAIVWSLHLDAVLAVRESTAADRACFATVFLCVSPRKAGSSSPGRAALLLLPNKPRMPPRASSSASTVFFPLFLEDRNVAPKIRCVVRAFRRFFGTEFNSVCVLAPRITTIFTDTRASEKQVHHICEKKTKKQLR